MSTTEVIEKVQRWLDAKPTHRCGVCLGHSPSWDGHALGCPTGLRLVLVAAAPDLLQAATAAPETTEVTDTERVAHTIQRLQFWISNLEYNYAQSSSLTRREQIRSRINDYQSTLALLDGRDDDYIRYRKGQS